MSAADLAIGVILASRAVDLGCGIAVRKEEAKTMSWSNTTMARLHEWLTLDTWPKDDSREMRRFFSFVVAVWFDLHNSWDEAEARKVIAKEAQQRHKELGAETVAEAVDLRVEQGSVILSFLAQTRVLEKPTVIGWALLEHWDDHCRDFGRLEEEVQHVFTKPHGDHVVVRLLQHQRHVLAEYRAQLVEKPSGGHTQAA